MGSFSIIHWIILLLVLALIFVPEIFYILSYQRAARAVNAQGGSAPVGWAWLLLIPLVNIVVYFVLLMQLRDSVSSARIATTKTQWWVYGLIAGILYVGEVAAAQIGRVPVPAVKVVGSGISLLLMLAWIVFAILHWVELAGLAKDVENKNPRQPRF